MPARHPWAYERGALWVMEFDVPATSPDESSGGRHLLRSRC